MSVTRGDRYEQKKVLFVESENLTKNPWAPCQMEPGVVVHSDHMTVLQERTNTQEEGGRRKDTPWASFTAGRWPCTRQL